MAFLQGMTVTLYDRVQTGVDGLNRPVYDQVPVQVDNVLAYPLGTGDITADTDLSGKHIRYALCIPKEDDHAWHGTDVEFFGERWHTVGVPEIWLPDLTPLGWNKRVTVERYE